MHSQEVHGLFQLLLADSWLEKSEVAQQRLKNLSFIRETLEEEVGLAMLRGAFDDACIFAAHISLLDGILQNGLASVQAEIVRVTRCRDHSGNR